MGPFKDQRFHLLISSYNKKRNKWKTALHIDTDVQIQPCTVPMYIYSSPLYRFKNLVTCMSTRQVTQRGRTQQQQNMNSEYTKCSLLQPCTVPMYIYSSPLYRFKNLVTCMSTRQFTQRGRTQQQQNMNSEYTKCSLRFFIPYSFQCSYTSDIPVADSGQKGTNTIKNYIYIYIYIHSYTTVTISRLDTVHTTAHDPQPVPSTSHPHSHFHRIHLTN